MSVINAFTVDLEDWYQTLYFESVIKREEWEKYESRIEKCTNIVLEILEEFNVFATFFVLGWNAEHYPDLIKKIYNKGHEIATHGYYHKLAYEMSNEEFKDDLVKSIIAIEKIIGNKVFGYRAPSFSLPEDNSLFFKTLYDIGLKYDSSILPSKKKGVEKKFFHIIKEENNRRLWEFPISVVNFWGRNIPFSGGTYLRVFPYKFIKSHIKKINMANQPVIIYVHPWEFDDCPPRAKTPFSVKLKYKYSHYLNLKSTRLKVISLLKDFQFTTIKEVLSKFE